MSRIIPQRPRRRPSWFDIHLFPAFSILMLVVFIGFVFNSSNSNEKSDFIRIPVPTQNYNTGTLISDMDFKFLTFPRESISKDVVINWDEVINSKTLSKVNKGLPLLMTSLTSFDKSISAKIPSGMRGITVKVDKSAILDGEVKTGSRVDVFLITNKKSRIVSEDIEVASLSEAKERGRDTVLVTLLARNEDIFSLLDAQSTDGRITFLLRNQNDTSNITKAKPIDISKKKYYKPNGFIKVEGGTNYTLLDETWVKTEGGTPKGILLGE